MKALRGRSGENQDSAECPQRVPRGVPGFSVSRWGVPELSGRFLGKVDGSLGSLGWSIGGLWVPLGVADGFCGSMGSPRGFLGGPRGVTVKHIVLSWCQFLG